MNYLLVGLLQQDIICQLFYFFTLPNLHALLTCQTSQIENNNIKNICYFFMFLYFTSNRPSVNDLTCFLLYCYSLTHSWPIYSDLNPVKHDTALYCKILEIFWTDLTQNTLKNHNSIHNNVYTMSPTDASFLMLMWH